MPTRRLFITSLLASAGLAMLAATPAALAFDRPFPPTAKRGVMRPDLFPAIIIDGRPRIMTPAARIWNTENMIEMPASLPVKNVAVNYTENDAMEIERVWILSDEEARQTPKQQNIGQQQR